MPGVNSALESAPRIFTAVNRAEGMSRQVDGTPNPTPTQGTTFWAALTGCDSTGLWWDWLAVTPTPAAAVVANDPWSFTANSFWSIREPYTAGWGNLREANGTRGIDAGTVVRCEFFGYLPAPSGATAGTLGMSTDQGQGQTAIDPSGAVPLYVFQYAMQPANDVLPVHDHRDASAGGMAFSCYHPGTNLPQQRWGF